MQIINGACTATLTHIVYEDNNNVLTLIHTNTFATQRVLFCKVSHKQPGHAAVKFNNIHRLLPRTLAWFQLLTFLVACGLKPSHHAIIVLKN